MKTTQKLIYDNPLACEADIKGFQLEGQTDISFENGRMRLSSSLPPELEQRANYVLWCPENFPDRIRIEWDFYPLSDRGLCMMFFAAQGQKGEDLFSPVLARRTGEYQQYFGGDINTMHLAYYRRRYPSERAFRVCNLRKSYGSHLVAQAGDPLPPLEDADSPYHMQIVKDTRHISFVINGLLVLQYEDKEANYLTGGKIGFRQMSPMIAEYADLKIWKV